jgi:hypothetical protein
MDNPETLTALGTQDTERRQAKHKNRKLKRLNLSSVSQNVLKFYQQLTGKERRIPFIFDDFHFCCSRVIGLDMTENRIFIYLYIMPF